MKASVSVEQENFIDCLSSNRRFHAAEVLVHEAAIKKQFRVYIYINFKIGLRENILFSFPNSPVLCLYLANNFANKKSH